MDFVNDDGENVCPLCMEEMDLTDRQLKPCKCGYEICVWCWHQVMEVAEKDNTEGRCPACRTPYDKEKIVGMTFNCERLMDASSEKRQKTQKSKAKASEMRKHLSNVRVIQRNLVYIIGIPSNLADEETLERREFFGQYGKVLKVSISKPSASNQHSSSNPTSNVYITYTKEEEAIRCIQVVNGYVLDGRPLKACFGTTKYCHAWLKNMPCNNPDCLYLHDIGTQEDSFTKEEMVSTCASKIPQFHGPTNPLQRRGGSCLPPPELEVCSTNLASSSKPSVKAAVSNVGCQAKTTVANGSTGKATPLPAAASWGLRVTQGKTLPTKAPVIPVSTKLKSSSSHALSVSPPSNPPTSAAVVAAAAAATSLLHSDHIQPSLVVVSSNGSQTTQTSPCSVISKQNIKNHQTRTNLTNGVAVDFSAGTPTTEKYIREDSPERRTRESRLQQNRGFHEVIERASDISLQSSAPTASSNIQNVHTEKSGYASVSSNIMTRSLSQEASVKFNHNFDDLSTSALNESSRAFHSSFNARKLSLDALTVSANLLCSDCNTPDEKSMAQSIKEVCVSEIEDQCTSTEAEEQCKGSVTKMLSETAGKLKHGFPLDANRRSFHSWKSTATSEAYADPAISKDDPSAVLSLETSNLDILNKNCFKTDKVDGKSDFSRVRSEGSILTPFQDSSIAEDRTVKVSAPAGEQISERFSISEKSQYLERHDSDKTHIRHHSGIDSGEDKIISNILSLNIDIWEDDSITSPHDVVTKALLGEKDKVTGFPKDIPSSRKLQNNGQSRFSFARHDGSSVESSHSSSKSLISSGQFQERWSKGKDSLDDRAGYDQVNRPLNERAAFDQEEYQILSNRTAPPPLSGSAVAPPSVSRSQFSAPPGFSVPTRGPQVPPPGFLPQLRVERTYEPPTTTVFSNGTKDQNEPILSQNAFSSLYSSASQTLGGNSSNDVEFIDPAIMAVGKGKFPIGQIQRGSAGPDSVFSGPRQDFSDSSFGQSYLGLRSPFLQQVSSTDYDARLQMLKQKPFYSNSSLTSPRQQFTFQDQIGDITSYLSRQNDTMIPSMMREQSQMSLDSVFSQQSFQQPMNLSYRSSSVGANGWDSWNRMSSAIESGLGERNFLEMGNKERMGAWDPKSGLTKSFPTYGESMYHMPCSENYYSRPFEM